ncbi:MAG: DUF1932 domain-containing protein [Lapillicoccus sp.]
MSTIAIVSPGAMGSALGRCWQVGGHRVVATLEGRSARTRALADGLVLLADLDAVVGEADLVVSICPPDRAGAVLVAVLAAAGRTGTTPLVLDANALSPTTVADLATLAESAGCGFVDGAVSGGPPRPGTDPAQATTLYLSGGRAPWVADLARDGFRTRVVGPDPGQASGVKMCTASVYKGTTAVWLQALQTARALGALDVVLEDLAGSDPDRVRQAARSIAMAASKSGRFVGEMEQISQTQGSAGASPELFAGMAAVYARVARSELGATAPEAAGLMVDLEAVLALLQVADTH